MKKNIPSNKMSEIISRFIPKAKLNKEDLDVFNDSIAKICERTRKKIVDNNESFLHGMFLPDSKKASEQDQLSRALARQSAKLFERNTPRIRPTPQILDLPVEPIIKYVDAIGIIPHDTPSGFVPRAFKFPPYTLGNPMPEHFSPQTNQWSNGAKYSSLSELSDREKGFINLGCIGGHAFWDGSFYGPKYPMTGLWLGGDMCSAHGSITQVERITGWVQGPSKIHVTAYLWNSLSNYLNGIYCFPGPHDGYAEGTVGWRGICTVTLQVGSDMSLKLGMLPTPVSESKYFMKVIIKSDPDDHDVFVEEEYAFAGPRELFAVDAEIPVDTFVDTLAITVSVDILCLRAGVDDPKGGMVGCAFQDATKTHKMMSDPWYLHPRPFEVPWIKICTQL